MTYHGRWTYKFEEAARRGALGALVVHETAAAGYGWNVHRTQPGALTYCPACKRNAAGAAAGMDSREATVDLSRRVGSTSRR